MTYFRRQVSPIKPGTPIDYKDIELLRITGLTCKQQRDLTQAIKRARILAMLPFVNKEG